VKAKFDPFVFQLYRLRELDQQIRMQGGNQVLAAEYAACKRFLEDHGYVKEVEAIQQANADDRWAGITLLDRLVKSGALLA
jgi:hypothetical protein